MNPSKVNRKTTVLLTDLPNVGKATAGDLVLMGIHKPEDLTGRDAVELYELLQKKTGQKQDPCVLDVFMSIIDFMNGNKARPWWDYTPKRKKLMKSLAST